MPTAIEAPRAFAPTTKRNSAAVIETIVAGRVTSDDCRVMCESFASLGRAPFWLIDAASATSYEVAAVDLMAREVMKLGRHNGLRTIVAVIQSRMVRMGASLVAMAVHTVDIRIVATRADAEIHIGR